MPKNSKDDVKLFNLANKATTDILNTLGIIPMLPVRKYVTQRIELACRIAQKSGMEIVFNDVNKTFKRR